MGEKIIPRKYYLKMEKHLENFVSYKAQLENCKLDLAAAKEFNGIPKLNYTYGGHGSSSINVIESELEEIENIIKRIKYLETLIEKIKNCLKVLVEKELIIIQLLYFEDLGWSAIVYSEEMPESLSSCKRIRKKPSIKWLK